MGRRWLVSVALSVACAGPAPIPRGEATFGPAGGLLLSDDGEARLEIPAEALAAPARISLRRVVPAAGGFAGDRAWSLGLAVSPAIPLELTMPCAGPCAGDERLGRQGAAGVVPIVDGTDLATGALRARVDEGGTFGVTRCARLYCLAAWIDDALTVSWLAPSLTMDGRSSPVVADVAGEARVYHLAGPDGEVTMTVPLDPAAPPENLRALSTPTGAVRLLWDPPVRAGRLVVRRQHCHRDAIVAERNGTSGFWDEEVFPGSWYEYRVVREGVPSKVVQLQPAAAEDGCAIVPYRCPVGLPADGEGEVDLEILPEATGPRWLLSLDEEPDRELIAGVAFQPLTTTSLSRLVLRPAGARAGQLTVVIRATQRDTQVSCRTSIRVVADEPVQPVHASGGVTLRLRDVDGDWVPPSGSTWSVPERGGGVYTLGASCDDGASRVVAATLGEATTIPVACPEATFAVPFTVEGGLPTGQCARLSVGRAGTPGCGEAARAHHGSQEWGVTTHADADGPALTLSGGWHGFFPGATLTVALEAAEPLTQRTATLAGLPAGARATVSLLSGYRRVALGWGGAEIAYGEPFGGLGLLELDVVAGDTRLRRWFSRGETLVADFPPPVEVSASFDGTWLTATLPAGIAALELRFDNARVYVSAGWLAASGGSFRLPDPDIWLGAPYQGAATLWLHTGPGEATFAELLEATGEDAGAPPGFSVRSMRLP